MLDVDDKIQVPLRELRFSYSTSRGPGGQNVNRVRTKATLHWSVTRTRSLPEDVRARFVERFRNRVNAEGEVVIHSQRFRDRGRNSADCIEKLRRMLREVSKRPRRRVPTRPGRGAIERRLDDKRRLAARKRRRAAPKRDGDA